MTRRGLAAVAVCAMAINACVGLTTNDETRAELEEARKHWARTTASFEDFQKKAVADIKALEEEQVRLVKELLTVRNGMAETQTDLESTRYHLAREQITNNSTGSAAIFRRRSRTLPDEWRRRRKILPAARNR